MARGSENQLVASPARTQSGIGSVVILCPTTLATALALATLDVFAWTSNGPSYRYVVATTWLVLAFAVDGALVGSRRRLSPSVICPLVLLGLWILALHVTAIGSATWAPDTLVILAGALPLLAAPAAYFAFPPRPQWRARMVNVFLGVSLIFSVAAALDAVLTPWGEQPTLLGHEKAFLAVVVVALPRTRVTTLCKAITVVALVVAFMKYPSATDGFVAVVSLVSFWLIRAKSRTSLNIRAVGLVVCFAVLAINSADWLAKFYTAVGRGDNINTRVGLWDQAINTVYDSPLVGSAASEPITGLANIRGLIQPVPFHNSFLALAACCGLVAVGLFALASLLLFVRCLSADTVRRNSARLWLPAFLGGLVTMSVNPVLENLGTGLPLYALMLCGSIDVPKIRESTENYLAAH